MKEVIGSAARLSLRIVLVLLAGALLLGCKQSNESAPVKVPRARRRSDMAARMVEKSHAPTVEVRVERRRGRRRGLARKVAVVDVSMPVGRSRRRVKFRLHRDGRKWWVLRRNRRGRILGATLRGRAVSRVLRRLVRTRPLRGLLPDPNSTGASLTLLGAEETFIMKVMRYPDEAGGHRWAVYRKGRLRAPSSELLPSSARRLLRMLKRMRRRKRWLLLPEESWGMDYRMVRYAARHLAKLRRKLRRCFRRPGPYRRRGALLLRLTVHSDGRIVKAKVVSKIRKPATPVWCAVWNVKRKRIPPYGGPPLRYRLSLP